VVEEASAVAQALGCKPDPRPMEIDAIFGMAVELARLVNVPTPTLDLLVGLAKARARRAGLYEG
jgi:2-dehydropantoate 2-reductase